MTPVPEDILITMTELRRHLHHALRQVDGGATFTIMRRGRPVARLVPYEPRRQRRALAARPLD